MLSVHAALESVEAEATVLAPGELPLPDALGCILAEDIVAHEDSPPADKALVDGYALRATDFANGIRRFRVVEQITAGQTPTRNVVEGTVAQIMTGAPVPAGADAVVMVELTQADTTTAGQFVQVVAEQVRAGQNIMPRGTSMHRGQKVLERGHLLRPIEIGLLAELGQQPVRVVPRPRLAILSTGNELVPADCRPAPGQLRNSNGPMLTALARQAGAIPFDLGIVADVEEALREKVAEGLESDLLVLSGGVSAGVLDLVPAVLARLGVRQVFHKVDLKPGKPIWFGVRERPGHKTLVFGLPGNPVSSLVCFELFVRRALDRLSNRPQASSRQLRALLSAPFHQKSERLTFFPAVMDRGAAGAVVRPLDWHGSADLRTLTEANGLAVFPPGNRVYETGMEVEFWSF